LNIKKAWECGQGGSGLVVVTALHSFSDNSPLRFMATYQSFPDLFSLFRQCLNPFIPINGAAT
jgi:hypothetical protein